MAVHAYSAQGIGNAIDAGADTLEHASFLDEQVARSAAARGQSIVPTLIAFSRYVNLAKTSSLSAQAVAKADRVYEAGRAAGRRARPRPRRPIAAGSDAGGQGKAHGRLVDELDQLVKAGLSLAQAAAATTVAARATGRNDLGVLAPGRRADIIAVSANPAVLSHPGTIIAAGRPIKINGTGICQ